MKLLKCTTPRGDYLGPRGGKEYVFVSVEHGIFESDPYVTVKELDSDETHSCHFYRFYDDKEFLQEEYNKLKAETPWQP